ncbi:MAG: DUF2203 domain-containing protein [Ardenticatenaceae bacterium]|nr:DUF2203 domain-containing protein [Anaerolineales bacterium]MCB8921052.1 DUF2203 domain-containing protein [Ardenticatenaceae bacterium]MCB8991184.1 DUF2203 domain-containing protein [Ardenticatenaceae bacterium]MCB9005741.1 DUF2203 domain-containing protein [Ardenticatenaceae bacterium]
MTVKYFTVEEANELLEDIEPLMGQLLETRAKVVMIRQQTGALLDDLRVDVGGAATSAMVQDFIRIEKFLAQIRAYGCEVKDLNGGLIDFLAKRDGRDIYLCWRYGEPHITHYHELHTGFAGRRPL